MQAPEALQGSNDALQDMTGPDLNVQKPPVPPAPAEGPSGLKAPAPQSAHDSNRRSGRTRTVRVRDGFFDSSLLHYVALNDPSAPAIPEEALAKERSPGLKTSNPKSAPATPDLDDDDDTPLGPDYQATIPACRPRPAQPTAAEAKFLPAAPLYTPVDPAALALAEKTGSKTRAGRAGVMGPMPPVGVASSSSDFRYKMRWAKDGPARRKLVAAAVNALDKQLGPNMGKVLGLEGLGFKRAQSWQPHEELLFCLGMCDKYRMFKYIRQCYLWSRSAHELNGYYHNVWKTRSTTEADEFLTLREEEASREEFEAFFDKVRDKLTAMWDRKKMGDMPKLVKDMAAAAAAASAAAPAKAKERNKQAELISSSSDDESDDASDSSTGTADDSDSSRRAARNKQRPRKRSAAAASGGTSKAASAKRVRRSTSNNLLQPVHGASVQQKPQMVQQQQQRRRQQAGLPTPTGTPALQQWLHPCQQQFQQRPRSGPRPGGGSGSRDLAGPLHEPLMLPDMPQLPSPDPRDQAAVAAWLKVLPTFKNAMSAYLDSVADMTDGAIQDCQTHISHLQQQHSKAKAQADAYLQKLLAQGQELVADITAKQQQQQSPVPPVKQEAAVPAAGRQPAAEQQQGGVPTHQQQQQQQQSLSSVANAGDISGSCKPGADGDKQQSLQQQQPLQQDDNGHCTSQQLDQVAAPDAAPHMKGPAAGSMECTQPQQQQQEADKDSQRQQQDQQQPKQEPQQDPAAAVDAASPLPFPGGPLSKWLAPRLQGSSSTEAVVIKHIPRPYIKRQKLEGGGTPSQE